MTLERTIKLLIFFGFLQNINCAGIHCSSQRKCRCVASSEGLTAHCSGLGLKEVPRFYFNVVGIDISNNSLSKFPAYNIPTNVSWINMSSNNISEIQNGSFQRLPKLEVLDLYKNNLQLNNKIYFPGIFRGVTKLKYLNVKKNSIVITPHVYPIEFTDLTSLHTLLIDGVDAPFGKEYSEIKQLKNIDISGKTGHCKIRFVSPNHFSYLTQLETLNISACGILRIENGTFGNLRFLKYVDISNNYDLTFRVLANITYGLQFTDIRIFKANSIHYLFGVGTELFKEDFKYLSNLSKLEELYLEENRLELIESGALGYLPKGIKNISIANNKFTMGFYLFQARYLPGLKSLNASGQHIGSPLKNMFVFKNKYSCDREIRRPCLMSDNEQDDEEIDPLENSKLESHEFDLPTDFPLLIPLPENLEYLYVRQCFLKMTLSRIEFSNNTLKYVDLSWNVISRWEGPIINVAVEYLDLSNNYCSYVSKDFFQGQRKLKTLKLKDNLLGFALNDHVDGEMFNDLKNLEYLDISNNHILSLNSAMFLGLERLEFLNISYNNIRDWQFVINHMTHLNYIDFSFNQLNTVPVNVRKAFDNITRYHSITVDLYSNSFRCTCENVDFLKWVLNTKVNLQQFHKYTCKYANGSQSYFSNLGNSILELELNCSSKIGLIAGVLSVILVFIIIVVGGLVYRFRWKLRYLYYMTKSKYLGYGQLVVHDDRLDYEYDAFISYADSDRTFVVNEMVEYLERNGECRLCIHHRDFVPGCDIAANITNAIHNSNKTVILLSASFLKSYWCMFEFNMARMESIYSRDGRNLLFLIFYENVAVNDLPMMMLELVESQSYIEYPNDPQGNIVFWDKIKKTILN